MMWRNNIGSAVFVLLFCYALKSVQTLPLVDPGVFVLKGIATCRNGEGYCLLGLSCTIDKDFTDDELGGHCDGLTNSFTSKISFVCCRYVNDTNVMKDNYETTISSFTLMDDKFSVLDEHPIPLEEEEGTENTIPEDVDPSNLVNIVGVVTDFTGIIKLITTPYEATTPSKISSTLATTPEPSTASSEMPKITSAHDNKNSTAAEETTENYNEIPLDLNFLQIKENSPVEEPNKDEEELQTEPTYSEPETTSKPEDTDSESVSADIKNNLHEIEIPFEISGTKKIEESGTTAYNDMGLYTQPVTQASKDELEVQEDLTTMEADEEEYGLKLPDQELEKQSIIRIKPSLLTPLISSEESEHDQKNSQTPMQEIPNETSEQNLLVSTHIDVKIPSAFGENNEKIPNNDDMFEVQRPISQTDLNNQDLFEVQRPLTDQEILDQESEQDEMKSESHKSGDKNSSHKNNVIKSASGQLIKNEEEIISTVKESPTADDFQIPQLQQLEIENQESNKEQILFPKDNNNEDQILPHPVNLNICGIKKPVMQFSSPKKIQPASVYEWCWSAAIMTKQIGKDKFECSGALIEPDLVVTTAACLKRFQGKDLSQFRVVLGDSNLTDDLPYGIQYHDIAEIATHPDFMTSRGSHANDIGLIRLKDYATIGDFVCLICLSQNEARIPKDSCVVSGYRLGDTPRQVRYDIEKASALKRGILHKSSVILDSSSQCASSLTEMATNPLLISNPESFLCDRKKKSVEGCLSNFEGGSPLVCNAGGKWFLTGLASWSRDCTSEPTVYTKVSSYSDWILSTRLRMYGFVIEQLPF